MNYALIKNGVVDKDSESINDYERILKLHKKFCYNFYWKYLINLYFRKFIKKIIGKKITTFIQNILTKIRKHK